MSRTEAPETSSDEGLMDLLRREPALRIADLSRRMGVTATAVRQRLTRLMGAGLVEREAKTAGRGRPSHRYRLTEKGRAQSGSNVGDLAVALWQEVRLHQGRRGATRTPAANFPAACRGIWRADRGGDAAAANAIDRHTAFRKRDPLRGPESAEGSRATTGPHGTGLPVY